jgi:hypothetical protein
MLASIAMPTSSVGDSHPVRALRGVATAPIHTNQIASIIDLDLVTDIISGKYSSIANCRGRGGVVNWI